MIFFSFSAVSIALLTRIAQKTDYALQMFQIRNDSRSGGTVGPMLSSAMGVRAIDAGIAQLSMHSRKFLIILHTHFIAYPSTLHSYSTIINLLKILMNVFSFLCSLFLFTDIEIVMKFS